MFEPAACEEVPDGSHPVPWLKPMLIVTALSVVATLPNWAAAHGGDSQDEDPEDVEPDDPEGGFWPG